MSDEGVRVPERPAEIVHGRPWDPDNKYSHLVLKEYQHWSLELSSWQRTLGAYFIFSKGDHERFSEMAVEEVEELLVVMRQAESAMTLAFKPDRFNYMQLGNMLHCLHVHGYPRYASERLFADQTWADESFTGWPSSSRISAPPEVLLAIKERVTGFLS